jgi:RNA polymerase sigma-70 factor, ECF subfamily
LARRLAGNEADAQDALQEGLIAIARGLARFDGRSAFTTWSYRVISNACVDELRRRARRPVPGSVTLDGAALAGDPPPGGVVDVTDAGIEAVARRLDTDAALARLPYEFRVAVVLRDLCDLDYAEIGRVLDIPPGTVRSRIARGRSQLADLVGNPAGSPDRPTTSP